MAEAQVNFEGNRAALAWRLLAALAVLGTAAWVLVHRAVSGAPITAGGVLVTVLALLALVLSGFFAITFGEDAARSGPVVSVGSRGILDRRIASDWIGWEWFGDIQPCRWPRGTGLMLYLHPGSETALPLRLRARLVSWVNWVLMPGVRWLFTKPLQADIPALAAAIDRFSGARFDLAKQLGARR